MTDIDKGVNSRQVGEKIRKSQGQKLWSMYI